MGKEDTPSPANVSLTEEEVVRVSNDARAAIANSRNQAELEEVRIRFLGRGDGQLTLFRRLLGRIDDPDLKRHLGSTVNTIVDSVMHECEQRSSALRQAEDKKRQRSEWVDMTRRPQPLKRGYLHPVTRVIQEVERIFSYLGYSSVDGSEIDYDHYNFTLVNMPPGHPSRDTQDTFYIDDMRLLRTQTTSVQIRCMQELGAPLKVIAPGKCFRRDNDATHSPMFHQVEGLCIDTDISLTDLKGTLEYFLRSFFGADRDIRLRPHHFSFTEPSLEVDIECIGCDGKGCSLCKKSGWLEILGSGMVHPTVLRNGGIDPQKYRGFAFGVGVERIAMLKYGVRDIRLFTDNDVRFLRPS